jgi:hypothetical protein
MKKREENALEAIGTGQSSATAQSSPNPRRPGKWPGARNTVLIALVAAVLTGAITAGILDRREGRFGVTDGLKAPDGGSTVYRLPRLSAPTRASLVVAQERPLKFINLDNRTVQDYSPLNPADTALTSRGQQTFVAVGRSAVLVEHGRALALPSGGDRYTDLGPASHLFASVKTGHVWLVSDPDEAGRCVAREVSLTGAQESETIKFEPELLPLAETPAGFITYDQRSRLSISSRSSGAKERDLTDDGLFLASWGGLVAWRAFPRCDARCSIHLYDVASGTDVAVPPPNDSAGFIDGAAFAADGATLAAFSQVPPPSGPKAYLTLVDSKTGSSRAIMSSAIMLEEPVARAAWDPESHWVFYSGGRGDLMALDGAQEAATSLGIPGSLLFVAIPS